MNLSHNSARAALLSERCVGKAQSEAKYSMYGQRGNAAGASFGRNPLGTGMFVDASGTLHNVIIICDYY